MELSLDKLSRLRGAILLSGETGTGKSYLAREIYSKSGSQNGKFVEVNLAVMSESLIEGELFGHKKGSFTGAIYDRKGYCEEVGDGTLFLDEIGELPLSSQKKLLQLLEEGVFSPIGSCSSKVFHGKIIAATNRDLNDLVDKGLFRRDLLFRLQVFTYRLRPLRERPADLLKLFEMYISKFSKEYKRQKMEFDMACKSFLLHYAWPGNIRELKNCIHYLVACVDGVVKREDLPEWIDDISRTNPERADLDEIMNVLPGNYYRALEIFENSFFNHNLKQNSGKVNMTADSMGISKMTLIAKARKYAINTLQIKANALAESSIYDKVA